MKMDKVIDVMMKTFLNEYDRLLYKYRNDGDKILSLNSVRYRLEKAELTVDAIMEANECLIYLEGEWKLGAYHG